MTVSAPRRAGPTRSAVEDLYDRMGRLMQDFLGDGTAPALAVPIDMEETDDAYIVEIELPGVRREDVDVQLRDGQLSSRARSTRNCRRRCTGVRILVPIPAGQSPTRRGRKAD
jgi:HSP20 family molecular chaperone IbpA